jgi:hypothetical protein
MTTGTSSALMSAAAAAATIVLEACGGAAISGHSGSSSRPASIPGPKEHASATLVTCSERSEANFPGAFSDSRNLVVGPLAMVGAAQPTSADTIRTFGGNKFPVLVRAGHEVTVRIARSERLLAGLHYGPSPFGTVRLRDTYATIKFVACPTGAPSGSSANGAVTFWSGFVVTRRPACVPLELYVDNSRSVRRAAVALGHGCARRPG